MKRREDDVNRKLYQTTLNRLKEQGIDVDLNLIESIIKSKWEFISYVIRFGQFESYRDKYLGNFGVKKWRYATKEYNFMSDEDKAYADSLQPLERLKWLDLRWREYNEAHKFENNKLYFPVIMTKKNGKEIEFNTLLECSKEVDILPIHIYLASVKGTKTKRGLKFRFKNNLHENYGNKEKTTKE